MLQTDIDQFYDELEAAIIARVPITLGNGPFSSRASVAQVHLLRLLPEGSGRVHAAKQVFSKTGSMAGVLDGLSVNQRVRQQLVRLVQTPLLYLLSIVLFASVGLLFFADAVAPGFEEMREDFRLPLVIDAPERHINTGLMKTTSAGLAIAAMLGVVFLLGGGARIIAMRMGGFVYYRCQICSSVLRIAQSLVVSGMHSKDALILACDLVGADRESRDYVLNSADQRSEQSGHFEGMYEHYQNVARSRLAVLRVAFPTIIVTLIGGAVVLLYCLALFGPVIDLIRDLALPGTVS